MTNKVVIAADLGSSGCKTVMMGENGDVLSAARCDYVTSHPRPGWVEQDPEDWYQAFTSSVQQVLAASAVAPDRIAGVGIIGVTHTAVLVDSEGRPLAPSILMFDSRTSDEVREIAESFGDEVEERTLNAVTSVWTWPHLAWLKSHRPELLRDAAGLVFQKDYVRSRICGSSATDFIDAAGSMLFDPIENDWIEPFWRHAGLSENMLPEVVAPWDVVGEIHRQGAADTGIPVGVPVIAGSTDTAAEMLGSGANSANTAAIKLASVGRVAVVGTRPTVGRSVLNYRHLLDDLWYPGTATKYGASAYGWLRGTMWSDRSDAEIYKTMDDAAASVPAGSRGVIFQPHLNGQWAPYWDDSMRAAFVGIGRWHGREEFTRAVLEGVAFAIRDALDDLHESGVDPAQRVCLIGQGAKSALWAQIVADVVGRELWVPSQVDAAYGGALLTAMGVGLLERSAEALKAVLPTPGLSASPDTHAMQRYDEIYELYKLSSIALCELNQRLTALDHATEDPSD